MGTENLLIFLFLGIVAGFLAGHIWKGSGFGLVGDLIVGVVGSFIGYWIFGQLHLSTGGGIIGFLIAAIIGALILLWLIRLVKRH